MCGGSLLSQRVKGAAAVRPGSPGIMKSGELAERTGL